MDIRQLRYALALAEHQHFGRAAAAVGIAQPPLSKAIASLEREVGARLFDRTPRGVFPTAAGEALLSRARQVVRELSAAGDDARRAARGETGQLRIGFIGSALLVLLPPVLRGFRAERPDVQLQLSEMSTTDSSRALLSGELDVIITRGAPRGPRAQSLVTAPLRRDHLVGVVSSADAFAGQEYVSTSQLQHKPLIIAPFGDEPATIGILRQSILGSDRMMPVTEARDVHTIVSLAACGLGVGLGPQDLRIAARPDTWLFEVRPAVHLPDLVLALQPGSRSPALSAFLAVIAAAHPSARSLLAGRTRTGVQRQ